MVELSDDPVTIFRSPSGAIYRAESSSDQPLFQTTLRSDLAFVLPDARALRIHVADLPTVTAGVSGGLPTPEEFLGVTRVVAVIPWVSSRTYALGTALGTVKRFGGDLPDKDEVSLISLRELDEVLGVAPAEDEADLVFVSREANLLAFPASSVRPQGLPAAGMAGINLGESRAVFFGVASGAELLVTAVNSSAALGDTDPGAVKITPLANYPRKGRGSMGVRCQKFLKGQDQVYFAGLSASSELFDLDGQQIESVATDERRDASGSALGSYLGYCR